MKRVAHLRVEEMGHSIEVGQVKQTENLDLKDRKFEEVVMEDEVGFQKMKSLNCR